MTWSGVGSIRGPQGSQGPTGSQGPAGSTGSTGPAGPNTIGTATDYGTLSDPAAGTAGFRTLGTGGQQAAAGNDARIAAAAARLTPTGTKTAAYTAAVNELAVGDDTAGSFTITLPSAAAAGAGAVVGVRKKLGSGNTITISRAGTDTIGGAAGTTVQLKLVDQTTILQSDGVSNWVPLYNWLGLPSLDSRYVNTSTLTAKGDLYAATASGTITRLPVGANGSVPVADSTQATGYLVRALTAAEVGAYTKMSASAVKTAAYTLVNGEIATCDASAGGFTVTLPAATNGVVVGVRKFDSSANVITIQRAGSDTIGGASLTSLTVKTLDQVIVLHAVGGLWLPLWDYIGLPALDARFLPIGDAKVTADQAANVASIRTLGTGALQATAGNDTRLSDERDSPASKANAANGWLKLDGSALVPQAQIPAIALTDMLGNVASQAAMLALTGQRGDWCYRTDLGTDWQLVAEPSTSLASWTEHHYPASPVSSVNGRVGAVTGLAEASALAGYQPVDSDLTTIAGLTATTDNFMVAASSAWASRTPAQAKASLAIAESDVANLTTDLAAKAPLASPTFTGTITGARSVMTPQAQSVTTTLAIDASTGDSHKITATGNPAMAAPTNGVDGQKLLVEVLASGGARTVTLNGSIVLTSNLSATLVIASGKVGILGLRYSALAGGVWVLLAATQTI